LTLFVTLIGFIFTKIIKKNHPVPAVGSSNKTQFLVDKPNIYQQVL